MPFYTKGDVRIRYEEAGSGLLALACASIGWQQRQRRRTTDAVIDMGPTPHFSQQHTSCWHMQDASSTASLRRRGRASVAL